MDKLEEIVMDIYKLQKKLEKRHKNYSSDILSTAVLEEYATATICSICEKGLSWSEDRVIYHCHLTAKYRGIAHNACNLNYKIPKFITIYLHNLSGYDSHLFIEKLRTDDEGNIKCIPKNEKNYISFSKEIEVDVHKKGGKKIRIKRELRFIDTFRFMSRSLDALSRDQNTNQCKNLGAIYR